VLSKSLDALPQLAVVVTWMMDMNFARGKWGPGTLSDKTNFLCGSHTAVSTQKALLRQLVQIDQPNGFGQNAMIMSMLGIFAFVSYFSFRRISEDFIFHAKMQTLQNLVVLTQHFLWTEEAANLFRAIQCQAFSQKTKDAGQLKSNN